MQFWHVNIPGKKPWNEASYYDLLSIGVALFIYHKSSHVCLVELFCIKQVVPEVVGAGGAAQNHTHKVGQGVTKVNI